MSTIPSLASLFLKTLSAEPSSSATPRPRPATLIQNVPEHHTWELIASPSPKEQGARPPASTQRPSDRAEGEGQRVQRRSYVRRGLNPSHSLWRAF